MKRFIIFLIINIIAAVSSSCNIDEDITTALPPKIVLDSENGIYTIKQGREITISPDYEYAESASFSWTMDGELISTSPALVFTGEELGEYFIYLTVTTEGGTAAEEIRIDVVELEIPTVSIAGEDHQTIALGAEISLNAAVRTTSLPTSIWWSIEDKEVGEGLSYTFTAEATGVYPICCNAANEDGSHSDTLTIQVLHPEDIPFEWEFDLTEYHTTAGRKLLIKPSASSNADEVYYTWQIDDNEAEAGDNSFVFMAQSAGEYTLKATALLIEDDNQITLTHSFLITVYDEGTLYRPGSATSKADWNKVYEYTPAPGQFINELKTGGFNGTQTTPEAAVAYAEARMGEIDRDGNPYPNWVSLGGFGGYIIVGFDHSIDNSGDYDIGILGNSFSGSSEPGIVWVMQDENGNGIPDDTWYELAGSETGKVETIQDYAVTYYRPTGPMMPVQWTDNMGNSGEIDYLKQFHQQEYYYPLWITEDSYTLTGTCLKARNYDASGNGSYWVNGEYDWGYADNFSSIDRLTNNENSSADANANHFKISNAIDFNGDSVHLEFIDFVKVQVGVNSKSGWLGEISTEIFGFYDYNLKK